MEQPPDDGRKMARDECRQADVVIGPTLKIPR